jgi:hypothetical protein
VTRTRVSLLAGALGAAVAVPVAAEGAPPRCKVTVDLAPERAYVGQQVHYRIRILRRRDVHALEWHTALSFPTFRAEWLPGVASDAPLAAESESWLEFLERRAIFPAHPGRLEIPDAALRCASADGEEVATVPGRTLEALPLPEEGRPPGFTGLIGPIAVTATAPERRMALGGTVHLMVLLEGEGNVWVAPSPRDALEAIPDADVFAHAPEIARDAGRTLRLRQYWSFEIVPLRTGRFRLPELRFDYFDPKTGRYDVARAEGLALQVVDAPEPRASEPPAREPQTSEARARIGRGWIAAALAAAAAGYLAWTAVGLRRRLARSRRARGELEPLLRPEDPARYADEVARALRDALAARVAGAGSASAEEILGRAPASGPIRDAALLLVRVDAIRFGGGGAGLEPTEVIHALRSLQEVPLLER